MKAKTRILAMLLTVLMVVGVLPLALFAAGETPADPVQNSVTNNSWETVKQTLEANGLDAYIYQSFENIDDTKFNAQGVIDLPGVHRAEWQNASGNPMLEMDIDHSIRYGNPFEVKNQKDAFSIRKEADGNKALYLGNATSTGTPTDDDNWFDIEMDQIAASTNALISLDLKMNGEFVHQAQDGETLLTIITRRANKTDLGRTDMKILGLHSDGGIFLWDNENRTDVVGYLSKTEYTRIAVETDVAANKYYVYINDVLVNPNGTQLISDATLKHIKGKTASFNYATDLLFAEARVYTIKGNTSDSVHKGMFIDNILLAGKVQLATGNTGNVNIYTMDLSGVPTEAVGGPVYAYNGNKIPGTTDMGKYLYLEGTSEASRNSVVYYKETDGSISIQQKKGPTSDDQGQSYPRLYIDNANGGKGSKDSIGKNFVIGGEYRAGGETICADTLLGAVSRVNNKYWVIRLSVDSNRNLKVANNDTTEMIGKIPTDRFIKVQMHVICNTASGAAVAKVYLDDKLVSTTKILGDNYVGQSVQGTVLTANTPLICEVHFNESYAKKYQSYAEDDLHYRGFTLGYTDAYNTASSTGRINPFAKKDTGFVKTAGITRYLENGVAKVNDFVLAGETYKVGMSGAIVGKVSDGVVQTPYAPYVDWAHTGTLIVNEPNGANIHGGSGTMKIGRYVVYKDGMFTKHGHAGLYSSFNPPAGYTADHNSYYDISLGSRKNNSNIVLDFDIMLGHKNDANVNVLMIQTLTDPYGASNSGHANRGDSWLLTLQKGWLAYNGQKIAKLSQSEFNRISIVVKTPDAVTTNGDEYAIGKAVYTEDESKRNVVTYSVEEFEALEAKPAAQEKTPNYTGEKNVRVLVSTENNTPEEGKRTLKYTITKQQTGTYTEVTVVNDGTNVVVTTMEGAVTNDVSAHEETVVYTLNGSYAFYVNGVEVVSETLIYSTTTIKNDDASVVNALRMFQTQGNGSFYIKDYYMYEGVKPQQFYTMVDGIPTLTSDQNAVAAKASDIKTGFVTEDGVTRYYNELGLVVVSPEFVANDGKTYATNENGKLICNGENHIGDNGKGECAGCGEKLDGISALYGTSLVLGSDVKVVSYLKVDTDKVVENAYFEAGLAIDYANGTTLKVPFAEADTVKINGVDYYKISYAVAAKDIYADVVVRFVNGDGTVGSSYANSAADYVENVLKMPTDEVYTEELKALASALLVYGKNASAALLGTETVEIDDSLVSWDGITGSGKKDYDGIIKLVKFSLELKSNIKIKVYFSFDAEVADDEYKATIENYIATVGEEILEIKDAGDGTYYFEYEVVATNLVTLYNFTVEHEDEGGGMKLSVSALYYAMIMNGNADSSVEYKNLMKAIKLYSDAAIAYANGIEEDTRPAV